jgi:phosphoribosylaminoimidazolecarboxamide formyltransferase/IMP cyclohydrolase
VENEQKIKNRKRVPLRMEKKIKSALISVFYKDGLEPLARTLQKLNITIYSTGGTQKFLEDLGIPCVSVESVTGYPSILGGRVKTLHPSVFGGILGRRYEAQDLIEMAQYKIPELDLVIVDLYPFEETLKNTNEEKAIIEKIDIGGPSMIRAAAKNFRDLVVLSAKDDYQKLNQILIDQDGQTNLQQRKAFAAKAFEVVMRYDIAISDYFNTTEGKVLRYGENPHQVATFYGDLDQWFTQLHGKELSYNNLVDVDAAIAIITELPTISFAIIKHTNVCGVANRNTVFDSWNAALSGDPESAFGGVLVTNGKIDVATAEAIQEIFFEVLIAPAFDEDAFTILSAKKNRVLLQSKPGVTFNANQKKSILNGSLEQGLDTGNYAQWDEVGARPCSEKEKDDLTFGNIICKHLKSNAIALIKDKQLVGKGCGQTSRVDALRHAIEKAKQFNFDLNGATLASDAFFPFDDCVRIAHAEGIEAFIQPGGSVRDKDSIAYCKENGLAMVLTQLRHFKH